MLPSAASPGAMCRRWRAVVWVLSVLSSVTTVVTSFVVPPPQSSAQKIRSTPGNPPSVDLLSPPLIGGGATTATTSGGRSRTSRRTTELYFWGNRNKKEDVVDPVPEVVRQEDKENEEDVVDSDESKKGSFIGKIFQRKDNNDDSDTTDSISSSLSSSSSLRDDPDDPVLRAARFKAQAERVRLEAEKLDAQLTLDKIAKLETELQLAAQKNTSTAELVQQLASLQQKLGGEPAEPAPAEVSAPAAEAEASPSAAPRWSPPVSDRPDPGAVTRHVAEVLEQPEFMRVIMARAVGLQPANSKDVNATEVAVRLEALERFDFGALVENGEGPREFSEEEIAGKMQEVKEFRKELEETSTLSEARKTMKEWDDRRIAIKLLEEDYYISTFAVGKWKETAQDFAADIATDPEKASKQLQELLGDEDGRFTETIMKLGSQLNKTEEYAAFETVYPACTQKEGEVPTEAQAELFVTEVLPKAGFDHSEKPIPIFGGWVIRGTTKMEKGDDLIDSIDAALAQFPQLRDKVTVSYVPDVSVLATRDVDTMGPEDLILPQSLLLLGPDVSRKRRRLLNGLSTSLAIATSWYLSIYPFLLNPGIMKRVEDQLALADSNMAFDLTFLTDSSVPLFLTFLGLQFTHEAAHSLVASINGLNTTFPTLVPSIVTGTTGTITNFKDPPKNREQLFDFAIAGPLVGMLSSLLAFAVGLQLTTYGGPDLPSLPLQILRQSTLAGAVVESILGNGILGVPEGAASSTLASMNIPLHPVAIAAFMSLFVNALSALPIGVTDGGRMALAVFGRPTKQIVGQLALLPLLLVGFFGGDDLFLFYAIYCLVLQQGSEIAIRNEVDEISFERVLLGTATGVLALLILIPIS